MPRYYFGFRQGNVVSRDHDGLEVDSLETAYLQAFWAARELWHECLLRQRDPMECAFEITDDDDNLLMVLPFSEVQESCRDRPLERVKRR
jgi:hypothetical protein